MFSQRIQTRSSICLLYTSNAQTTARALKQVAAQKKPEKASPLPLVLGCLALVLGVGLSFVQVLAGVAAFVVLALAAVVLFVQQKGKKQEEDLSAVSYTHLKRTERKSIVFKRHGTCQ